MDGTRNSVLLLFFILYRCTVHAWTVVLPYDPRITRQWPRATRLNVQPKSLDFNSGGFKKRAPSLPDGTFRTRRPRKQECRPRSRRPRKESGPRSRMSTVDIPSLLPRRATYVSTNSSPLNKSTSSSPEGIEEQVSRALQSLRDLIQSMQEPLHSIRESETADPTSTHLVLFPTTRECNTALAAFGDAGDLLRALRLFGKMRTAATLQQKLPSLSTSRFRTSQPSSRPFRHPSIPSPTLVTYSTLMSRANSLGKPRVALRLWKLMLASSSPTVSTTALMSNVTKSVSTAKSPWSLDPDTKSVNILLNAYAKLADLESARHVLLQMKTGSGPDVFTIVEANIVTYNTVLDACLKAGDLDAALQTKADLDASGLPPDARTYTNLIATVARRTSAAAGQNDPSLAFALLQEMKDRLVKPNGMTYCALIDAAGRCQRSDLALQGLRIMLRQHRKQRLDSEVGAWTAAIDACGKAGRLDTALRLFYAMPKFRVLPNTVTCGCLTDSLLREGRTADTLAILRYMKANGIAPSEVMYTSLMSRAERLARSEHKLLSRPKVSQGWVSTPAAPSETKAIEVYTELISSLTDSNPRTNCKAIGRAVQARHDSNTLLLKVFLVFQEMKAVGVQPDLACFNALLRACARSGDLARAQDVLRQLQASGLVPNDASWRQLLRAASGARRSDLAVQIWKRGMSSHVGSRLRPTTADEPAVMWKPSAESFRALLMAHVREAVSAESADAQISLYGCVLDLFDLLLLGDEKLGLNRLDPNSVLDSQPTMLLVLQAIVALHRLCPDTERRDSLERMGCSIIQLECFRHVAPQRIHWASAAAHCTVASWRAATTS